MIMSKFFHLYGPAKLLNSSIKGFVCFANPVHMQRSHCDTGCRDCNLLLIFVCFDVKVLADVGTWWVVQLSTVFCSSLVRPCSPPQGVCCKSNVTFSQIINLEPAAAAAAARLSRQQTKALWGHLMSSHLPCPTAVFELILSRTYQFTNPFLAQQLPKPASSPQSLFVQLVN